MHSRQGSALIAGLLLALLASAASLMLLSRSSQSATVSRRMLDYQRARVAAEAGLDYGRSELVSILREYQFVLSDEGLNGLIDGIADPPSVGEYVFETPGGQVAFKIEPLATMQQGLIPEGSVASGIDGDYQYFTITCGAKNPQTGTGAVLQETVMAVSVFLMRFGVFYEDDLEVDPGPPMVFEGWVHGNSDVYVGGPLDFLGKLTSHENIWHKRKDTGLESGEAFIANEEGQLVSMRQFGGIVDSGYSDWMVDSLNLWDGNVKSAAHAVPHFEPPINPLDEPHDLIERPIPSWAPGHNPDTESEKLSNNAALTVHVDSSGNVTVTDYHGTDLTAQFDLATLAQGGSYDGKPLHLKDGDGQYATVGDGVVDAAQQFYDGRELQTMLPVDIYVDKLVASYPELYQGSTYSLDEGRGVVYVTRDDPDGAGGVEPVLRIRNGDELPAGGLTFASDMPVYVEGSYNTINRQPSLVSGDAVTLLSRAWQDARSEAGLGERLAESTTFNAVILTGNSETQPGVQYNGGLENVLRFQENWSGIVCHFRGSIIDLWFSEIADGLWGGSYYSPPDRDWGYDSIYLSEAPPGIPRVFGVEQIAWNDMTWEQAGW